MRTVGLLGGSFNPAHEGHRHISLLALKTLGLNEIWWLVSPQNPLKDRSELANYTRRLTKATEVANHPHIHIRDDESHLQSPYTIDTITYLQSTNPRIRFVWLMGSDNLIQFHRWHEWKSITRQVAIAVIDRNQLMQRAIHSVAGNYLQPYRVNPPRALLTFPSPSLPRWTYISGKRHPLSASHLRETLGILAF